MLKIPPKYHLPYYDDGERPTKGDYEWPFFSALKELPNLRNLHFTSSFKGVELQSAFQILCKILKQNRALEAIDISSLEKFFLNSIPKQKLVELLEVLKEYTHSIKIKFRSNLSLFGAKGSLFGEENQNWKETFISAPYGFLKIPLPGVEDLLYYFPREASLTA